MEQWFPEPYVSAHNPSSADFKYSLVLGENRIEIGCLEAELAKERERTATGHVTDGVEPEPPLFSSHPLVNLTLDSFVSSSTPAGALLPTAQQSLPTPTRAQPCSRSYSTCFGRGVETNNSTVNRTPMRHHRKHRIQRVEQRTPPARLAHVFFFLLPPLSPTWSDPALSSPTRGDGHTRSTYMPATQSCVIEPPSSRSHTVLIPLPYRIPRDCSGMVHHKRKP